MMLYKKGIIRAIAELKGSTASAEAIRTHMWATTFPARVPWQNDIFVKVLTSKDFVKVGNSYKLSEKYKQKLVAAAKRKAQNQAKPRGQFQWPTRVTGFSLVGGYSPITSNLSSVDRVYQERVAASKLALKRATRPIHKEYTAAIVEAMGKLDDKTGFGHYLQDIKNYLLANQYRSETWRNGVFHEALEAGTASGDFVRIENYFKFSDEYATKMTEVQTGEPAFHIGV